MHFARYFRNLYYKTLERVSSTEKCFTNKIVKTEAIARRCSAKSVFLNFIKKRLQHRCLPLKFAKFLRTLSFTKHLRQRFNIGFPFSNSSRTNFSEGPVLNPLYKVSQFEDMKNLLLNICLKKISCFMVSCFYKISQRFYRQHNASTYD